MSTQSAFGVGAALARIGELHALRATGTAAPSPAVAGDGAASFDAALSRSLSAAPATASAPGDACCGETTGAVGESLRPGGLAALASISATGTSSTAARRIALAAGEIGVAESPPGSNDGARIAEYRRATAGSGVGPWCAYFVSWVGAQAGTPLGEGGRGEGYVPTIRRQLERDGRYLPATQGTGRPGDLILFDRNRDGLVDHIGLVESVGADGRVHTIEGNSSDAVRRRSYRPDQVAGYGRLP
jgi:cell wall-associated NlpC family hydrolase